MRWSPWALRREINALRRQRKYLAILLTLAVWEDDTIDQATVEGYIDVARKMTLDERSPRTTPKEKS